MGTYYHFRICHRNKSPALLPPQLTQARATHIPRPLVHQESVKRKTQSEDQLPLSRTPIASLLQNEDIMQSFEMKWKMSIKIRCVWNGHLHASIQVIALMESFPNSSQKEEHSGFIRFSLCLIYLTTLTNP